MSKVILFNTNIYYGLKYIYVIILLQWKITETDLSFH